MTTTTVTTQAELDTALANAVVDRIEIRSEQGVWLQLRPEREVFVDAWDNSSVVAWGNSSVVARDNSSVVAWGNSSVDAWDNSSVVARGNSSVVARDNSSVVARGNSSVVARGNSSVVARDNSSVDARGAAGVHAYGYGTVKAGPHVAVWLHRADATVEGGVLIDLTAVNLDDTGQWLAYHGIEVVDGRAVLYKAVDADLMAGHHHRPTTYTVGVELVASDWRDDHACGGGLHLSPNPAMARDYFVDAERYLRCTALVEDIRVIDGSGASTPKVKVRALRVETEVDVHRRPVPAPAASVHAL